MFFYCRTFRQSQFPPQLRNRERPVPDRNAENFRSLRHQIFAQTAVRTAAADTEQPVPRLLRQRPDRRTGDGTAIDDLPAAPVDYRDGTELPRLKPDDIFVTDAGAAFDPRSQDSDDATGIAIRDETGRRTSPEIAVMPAGKPEFKAAHSFRRPVTCEQHSLRRCLEPHLHPESLRSVEFMGGRQQAAPVEHITEAAGFRIPDGGGDSLILLPRRVEPPELRNGFRPIPPEHRPGPCSRNKGQYAKYNRPFLHCFPPVLQFHFNASCQL